MSRSWILIAGLLSLVPPGIAAAAPEASSVQAASSLAAAVSGTSTPSPTTYVYSVEHPTYGTIGTFSDTVIDDGHTKRIDSQLRVAVRVLGIVMHREEADRTEIWRDGRLAEFRGVTRVNGTPIEVRGEARGNSFVVSSPNGVASAPADVYPSSPWVAMAPNRRATLMSTKTGKLMPVTTAGGETTEVEALGTIVPARHFEFFSDKRQDVWLDASGVPVRFRTEQGGSSIDFVLTQRHSTGTSGHAAN